MVSSEQIAQHFYLSCKMLLKVPAGWMQLLLANVTEVGLRRENT
jgi:hypothetical protein